MAPSELGSRVSAWRRVGKFLFDWAKSLGLYAVVVSAGTFVFLVGSSIVGYLAYSDRPGPGWGRGAFSWSEVRFFLGWLPFLMYFLLYLGATLFPFARLLGWLGSPRWLLRIFGGLFSGTAALVGVLAAGWYIAISQYPAYAGAVCGITYGAVLLPRFSGSPRSGPTNWKRWAGIAGSILGCGTITLYPLLPKQSAQSLEILFVCVVPGPQDLASDGKTGGLTTDELSQLKLLGLRGTLHFGMSQFQGSSPAQARAIVVFTRELHSSVELREPHATHVIYVEHGDAWRMYPPDAPTVRNKIKFWPSTKNPGKVEVQTEPADGDPTAFSWYPPLPDLKQE
jgi:hypothetical protein